MDGRVVIETLRTHQGELEAAGIVHLRVFGSVARGESTALSDIDLMADFDASRSWTLVGLGRLQSRLTELLGTSVDLSSAEWMAEPIRTKASREALVVF